MDMKAVRPFAWLAVVCASVAAGWYIDCDYTGHSVTQRSVKGNCLFLAGGSDSSLPVANGAVGVHCKAITTANINDFREQLRRRLDVKEES